MGAITWSKKTYLNQLVSDSGHSLDELSAAMIKKPGWKELVKRVPASSKQ